MPFETINLPLKQENRIHAIYFYTNMYSSSLRRSWSVVAKQPLPLHRFFSLLEKNQAKDILRRTDAVCFDVDSTVIDEEGIDVLAAHNGAGEAVAEWTRKYVYIF